MDFEKAKEFIEASIKDFPEDVECLYQIILNHIELLEKNEKIENYNGDSSKQTIRFLMLNLIEGPVTNNRLQFFEGMSFIVYNWNLNVLNDPDITAYCLVSQKIIECFMSMKTSLLCGKKALETFHRYQSWLPPVNDVTIKYLDMLFEENERCCTEQKTDCCG